MSKSLFAHLTINSLLYGVVPVKAFVVVGVFCVLGEMFIIAVVLLKNRKLKNTLSEATAAHTAEIERRTAVLRRMYSLAENAPQYIAYVNRDGRFDYINPAAYDRTGFTYDELMEGGIHLLYDDETNRRIREEIIPKIFELGRYEFELPLIRKDGETRIMSFSAFTISSDEFACGTIAMDITEKKQIEEQLIHAKEEALQSSRSKSAFLSRMSHEIRTPLNAVIGMTKIAKGTDNIKKKNDCLDKIDTASAHLLGVVNNVLDISKIEAGKFDLIYTELNLLQIISKVINVYQYQMDEKEISFDCHIDENVPENIISDKQRITQVLTNIIGNAVKFTPLKGEISLKLHRQPDRDDLCVLDFVITDTGVGISKEFQKRIFDSYAQESDSGAHAYSGTGLGLLISKQLAEMLGGDIFVESEIGNGACFTFTLRAKYVTSSAEAAQTPAPDITGRSLISDNCFLGKRILLVDDVDINREIVEAMLERTGIQIDSAHDGQAAVEMFEKDPDYDLIFMDIHMPRLNGLEATKRIRDISSALKPAVPIIAMTADAFREDIELCRSSGMDGHIGKPLEMDVLLAKLQEHLN